MWLDYIFYNYIHLHFIPDFFHDSCRSTVTLRNATLIGEKFHTGATLSHGKRTHHDPYTIFHKRVFTYYFMLWQDLLPCAFDESVIIFLITGVTRILQEPIHVHPHQRCIAKLRILQWTALYWHFVTNIYVMEKGWKQSNRWKECMSKAR